MHSLRTRITLLTVCVVIVALTVVTFLSVMFIRNNERLESDQLLLLLCETGERNLDYYFNSVQKSVSKVAAFVEKDLDGLETEQLERHMEPWRRIWTAWKRSSLSATWSGSAGTSRRWRTRPTAC